MVKKYKVLFLASWFPSRVNPVEGIFIQKHAKLISGISDIAVLYVIADKNLKEKKFEIDYSIEGGVASLIVYYKAKSLKSYFFTKLIDIFMYVKGGYIGIRILREKFGKIDIVHVNAALPAGIVALLLKLTTGVPYVITEHCTFYTDYDGRFNRSPIYVRLLVRMIFRYADAIGAISNYLMSELKKRKLAIKNLHIIKNIIEIPPALEFNRDHQKINILTVSLFVDVHKNISGLIKAFSNISPRYDNADLHIIGDGKDRAVLEKLAADNKMLNRKIFFHGFVSNDSLSKYFSKANFFVLNSNYETFSVATAEAIGHGLPVVVTKCGGPEEFVTNEVGVLVERQNKASLIAGLEYMINNWHLYNPKRLRDYIRERFVVKKISFALKDMYDSVMIRVHDTESKSFRRRLLMR